LVIQKLSSNLAANLFSIFST